MAHLLLGALGVGCGAAERRVARQAEPAHPASPTALPGAPAPGAVLIPRLEQLLTGMRAHLAGPEGAALSPQMRADADLFTGVAHGLLDRKPPPPAAGASAADMATWIDDVTKASGAASRSLFGAAREVDLSQFKPRGHYADNGFSPANGRSLSDYFRAVMWLGRVDLPVAVPSFAPGRPPVLEVRRRDLESSRSRCARSWPPPRRRRGTASRESRVHGVWRVRASAALRPQGGPSGTKPSRISHGEHMNGACIEPAQAPRSR